MNGGKGSLQDNSPWSMPLAMRLFEWITIGLTLLCLGVEWVCVRWLHWPYPYTWPLMSRNDPYCDFYFYKDHFAVCHSASFFT